VEQEKERYSNLEESTTTERNAAAHAKSSGEETLRVLYLGELQQKEQALLERQQEADAAVSALSTKVQELEASLATLTVDKGSDSVHIFVPFPAVRLALSRFPALALLLPCSCIQAHTHAQAKIQHLDAQYAQAIAKHGLETSGFSAQVASLEARVAEEEEAKQARLAETATLMKVIA
jgi:hypothetical protein